MVLDINSAYAKRFGSYAVDLPHVINDALKMNHLSEQTLRNLLMTLYSFYQDQYGQKTTAEKPLLTTSSLTQDSVNQLIKLLQQENISSLPAGLQQNNLSSESNTPQLAQSPEQASTQSNQSPQLDELLESIRYASMVDS
jgi:hypothetical protein